MSEKGGGQSGGSAQAGAVTVSDVQELIRRKEEIEEQIKANYDVLESVSVGAGLPGRREGAARPPGRVLEPGWRGGWGGGAARALGWEGPPPPGP